MKAHHFVTDMAVEAAESSNCAHLTTTKTLSYGIEQRVMKVNNLQDAKMIGRELGLYVTYDVKQSRIDNNRVLSYLEKLLADTLKGLIGTIKKSSPVLVVGLGNEDVVADSLGKRVVSNVRVVPDGVNTSIQSQRVCAISSGVLGTTGVQSAEIVSALTNKLKPSCVLLVDALATSNVSRLGLSYQISTAGISPGSGVGQDKQRIDKSVLGVKTIAIGVPLMLSMKTALYSFVKDYTTEIDCKNNEFKLREMLADKQLSNLVVAPKDIDFLVEMSALVIANSINKAFE